MNLKAIGLTLMAAAALVPTAIEAPQVQSDIASSGLPAT
jgi:hypothetical protein